jgi:hypothetical protein
MEIHVGKTHTQAQDEKAGITVSFKSVPDHLRRKEVMEASRMLVNGSNTL